MICSVVEGLKVSKKTSKDNRKKKLLFSQRYGFKPVRTQIQLQSMDDNLRIGLWNALSRFYWLDNANYRLSSYPSLNSLLEKMWEYYFKLPIQELDDHWHHPFAFLHSKFLTEFDWYEVYDFIEFVAKNSAKSKAEEFRNYCNSIFERELSAYRFVGERITPITSETEIEEVELALESSKPFQPVYEHLQSALDLLSDRKNPDYRNSIKESISAIEAVTKITTGEKKGTLGRILKKLDLHPDLETAFRKLYGYTSDADGIRHALMEKPNLSFEEAKFMLVICSAFFNYVITNYPGGSSSK